MATLFLIGGRDTDQAMNARFAAQHAIGVTTFDLHAHTIEPDPFPWNKIEQSRLPAFLIGIMGIHLVEHLGPVLSL